MNVYDSTLQIHNHVNFVKQGRCNVKVKDYRLTVQTWNPRQNRYENTASLASIDVDEADILRNIRDFVTDDTHGIEIKMFRGQ